MHAPDCTQVLHAKFVARILIDLRNILKQLPSLVDVPVPKGSRINVCGDTHGQYYDLLNIFEIKGWPSEDNPFLFNGDFVDRGSFSVEVVLLLFALKVCYRPAILPSYHPNILPCYHPNILPSYHPAILPFHLAHLI